MINCPKCGADNMIGAIFCRTCGEKLNLNELSPDVFDAPPVPVGAKVAKILQRVLILVALVAILALVAALFFPTSIVATGSLDQKASETAGRKFAALQAPTPRTPSQIPFSSDEATAVVNQTLGLPSSGSGNKKPQILSVEFLPSGNCKFILKTLVFGQVPMYTVAIAKPSVSTPGTVKLDVLRASAGKLPLPGPLKKQAITQFSALNVASAFAAAEAHVQAVNVTSGTCTITVKP
jgi:hypothetical protein